jgi:hypothetical protein
MLIGELWPGVGSVPGCDGCGATPLPPPPPYSSLAASLLLSCKYYTIYSWKNVTIMTSKIALKRAGTTWKSNSPWPKPRSCIGNLEFGPRIQILWPSPFNKEPPSHIGLLFFGAMQTKCENFKWRNLTPTLTNGIYNCCVGAYTVQLRPYKLIIQDFDSFSI